MYDVLLALHLLSAAITFITLVIFSAWAFGSPVRKADFALADAAWNVSGFGLLVFGVWLALYIDGYELWDGWILGCARPADPGHLVRRTGSDAGASARRR